MIYLHPKNLEDSVQYSIDFADLVPSNFVIETVEVSAIEAGNTESPIALTASDAITASDLSPPGLSTVVLMTLAGGTRMTWYLLKIAVINGSNRRYTRYVKIQVRDDI